MVINYERNIKFMIHKKLYIDPHTDPNYQDSFCLGRIDFSEDLNEQEIGGGDRLNLKNIGECKVMVYGGEGTIPHFHLENVNDTFESCIKIYAAEYFAHGGKYTDTLNSKQRKELNEWLKKKSKHVKHHTNWQAIVSIWELSNEDNDFPESKKVDKQPDYSKMTNYKGK